MINIQTTQLQLPGLYGAIVSFFSPALYSIIISLLWPSRFDWREFLRIDLIEDKSQPNSILPSQLPSSEAIDSSTPSDSEKGKDILDSSGSVTLPTIPPVATNSQIPIDDVVHPFDEDTLRHIRRWFKISAVYFVVNVLVTIVLWPLPLYRDYIFTKTFFGGWVTMAIIWHFAAMVAVIVYPVWDGRKEIERAVKGMVGEVRAWRGAR